MSDDRDNLETSNSDRIAAAVRMLGTLVPGVGSLIGEAIGSLIPHQRMDRAVAFLRLLADRIAALDARQAHIEARLTSAEGLDLLEDGIRDAARALTPERMAYIATAVANGLTDDTLAHLETKRLLSILAEVNDVEIIILKSYDLTVAEAGRFHTGHVPELVGPARTATTAHERRDRTAVYDTYRQHLRQLGLITPRVGPNELEEFDPSTRRFRPRDDRVTDLGHLLLRHVGLSTPAV